MVMVPLRIHGCSLDRLFGCHDNSDMTDIRIIVVLAVAAVVLTGGIAVLAVINPVAALGLAPVLMAIAVIIRSIRGAKHE
jgi:ABC-type transport system involved in cytochrome bd biosynthesis fused ATPase/permease subunit